MIGHGQMRERELEQVMLDFYHRRSNVLLCTTIIESGIDIPTANTIVIDRADRFGLAQLHQLRGRVGRSHHQAYAYLIAPPRNAMTGDAAKRLEAIESLEDLGAGFVLATHDLEIRGAGELLGEEQSGQIQEIGFALYMELLERAVAALRAGRQPELETPAAPRPRDRAARARAAAGGVPARRACAAGDVQAHLGRRHPRRNSTTCSPRSSIASARCPSPRRTCCASRDCASARRALGVERLDVGHAVGSVAFGADTPIDAGALIVLVQRSAKTMRFDGSSPAAVHRRSFRSPRSGSPRRRDARSAWAVCPRRRTG